MKTDFKLQKALALAAYEAMSGADIMRRVSAYILLEHKELEKVIHGAQSLDESMDVLQRVLVSVNTGTTVFRTTHEARQAAYQLIDEYFLLHGWPRGERGSCDRIRLCACESCKVLHQPVRDTKSIFGLEVVNGSEKPGSGQVEASVGSGSG